MNRRLPLAPEQSARGRTVVAESAAGLALAPQSALLQPVLALASSRVDEQSVQLGVMVTQRLVALGRVVQPLWVAEPAWTAQRANAFRALRAAGAQPPRELVADAALCFDTIAQALAQVAADTPILAFGNALLCHVRPRLSLLLAASGARASWLPSALLIAPRVDLVLARPSAALADELARTFASPKDAR